MQPSRPAQLHAQLAYLTSYQPHATSLHTAPKPTLHRIAGHEALLDISACTDNLASSLASYLAPRHTQAAIQRASAQGSSHPHATVLFCLSSLPIRDQPSGHLPQARLFLHQNDHLQSASAACTQRSVACSRVHPLCPAVRGLSVLHPKFLCTCSHHADTLQGHAFLPFTQDMAESP